MKSGTNKIVGHLNNIRKGDVIGIYMQDSISNFKISQTMGSYGPN